jgi:hypothetical protein
LGNRVTWQTVNSHIIEAFVCQNNFNTKAKHGSLVVIDMPPNFSKAIMNDTGNQLVFFENGDEEFSLSA